MKGIDAVLEIGASPQEVWDTLADFDSYYQWNPYIRSVKGKLALDSPLDITFRMGDQERRIRGKVTIFYPPQELCFTAHLGLFGMLTLEHAFHIEDFGDGRVCFVQRHTYSGLLASEGRQEALRPQTREAFDGMNAALKERVEQGSRVGVR